MIFLVQKSELNVRVSLHANAAMGFSKYETHIELFFGSVSLSPSLAGALKQKKKNLFTHNFFFLVYIRMDSSSCSVLLFAHSLSHSGCIYFMCV